MKGLIFNEERVGRIFAMKNIENLEKTLKIKVGELYFLAKSMDRYVSVEHKPKEDGKTRIIYKPHYRLRSVQKQINKKILQKIPLPDFFHGGIIGKSPKTNALPHVGKPILLTLDIRDFYPSIHYSRIYDVYKKIGCIPKVARLLTRITTYNGCLAQGFPTSSSLANLILARTSPRLEGLKLQHGITIGVYQDDLGISGGYRIPELINLFEKIMRQEGFFLHIGKKRKVMSRKTRQEITGYVVNRKVNVSKSYYRDIRAKLQLCKAIGIAPIAGDISVEEFMRQLRGKIQYVMDANPERGRNLLVEFEDLLFL